MYEKLNENDNLTLTLMADFNRCTRESPNHSSTSLLAPLTKQFPNRVNFYLYKPNSSIDGKDNLIPKRWREGWGTQHTKIYLFDNDVLLTGANLNSNYFENRQDRYMYIKSNQSLSSYLKKFLTELSKFSYKVSCDNDDQQPVPYTLNFNNDDGSLLYDKEKFSYSAKQSFINFTNENVKHNIIDEKDEQDDGSSTYLIPIIQSGLWNLRQEEEVIKTLIESCECIPGSKIDITSGYFSLCDDYKSYILNSNTPTNIIAASPSANGFLNSKGISNLIPEAYTHLEKKFYNSYINTPRNDSLKLKEWSKNGWTYHCKGECF